MSKFENFISSLTDHELAIFVGYRYQGFLASSKEKILAEIKKRKLSSDQLEAYFTTKLESESAKNLNSCPRCGSNQLFVETDYQEKPVSDLSSVEIAIDTFRCRLCGFNPDKDTPKNFFDRLKRKIKNNKHKRIINWNSL